MFFYEVIVRLIIVMFHGRETLRTKAFCKIINPKSKFPFTLTQAYLPKFINIKRIVCFRNIFLILFLIYFLIHYSIIKLPCLKKKRNLDIKFN